MESDGFSVVADQMIAEGAFVKTVNFDMNFVGGNGPPASLASLPCDVSTFQARFINIMLGPTLVSANVTSCARRTP